MKKATFNHPSLERKKPRRNEAFSSAACESDWQRRREVNQDQAREYEKAPVSDEEIALFSFGSGGAVCTLAMTRLPLTMLAQSSKSIREGRSKPVRSAFADIRRQVKTAGR